MGLTPSGTVSTVSRDYAMADNLNIPSGAVPPKPTEGAKVQPKKETVRISLPPKPTAKETVRLELPPKPQAKETVRLELPPKPAAGVKLPAGAPSLSLVVPQIGAHKQTVQIPSAVPTIMAIATPSGPPAAPGVAKAAPPAAKPAEPVGARPAVVVARAAAPAAPDEEAPAVASAHAAPVGKSVSVPAAAPKKAPVEKALAVAGAPGRTSIWDIILAVLAFLTSGAALVRLWMILN